MLRAFLAEAGHAVQKPRRRIELADAVLRLSGSYLAYVFYQEGSTAMAVMSGSLAVMCLLVWFDAKWVAIPLIGWFSLVLVGGLLLVCFKEFSTACPLPPS